MNLKTKPYFLLLTTGVLLVLSSVFVLSKESEIGMHLNGSYYVISQEHFLWILAFIALFTWIFYVMTNRFLFSKLLTWTHVIITVIALLAIGGLLFTNYEEATFQPGQFEDHNSSMLFSIYTKYAKAITILVSILLLGQLIYLTNLLGGLFKRRS